MLIRNVKICLQNTKIMLLYTYKRQITNKRDKQGGMIMKNIRKFVAALLITVLLSCIPVNELYAKENVEETIDYNEVRIIETLPNGWTKFEYIDYENQLSRAQGKGYSKYIGYFDSNKMLICEFKTTVGFNYGYSDGIVKITSLSYTQTYIHDGCSLVFTNATRVNGSPAIATVYYTIYINSNKYLSDKTTLKCYNNGNVVVN